MADAINAGITYSQSEKLLCEWPDEGDAEKLKVYIKKLKNQEVPVPEKVKDARRRKQEKQVEKKRTQAEQVEILEERVEVLMKILEMYRNAKTGHVEDVTGLRRAPTFRPRRSQACVGLWIT